MHYEAKYLCDNNIYSISLTIPEDMYKDWSIEKRDRMIDITIEADKELKEIDSFPHTITELKRSKDGITWVEMI